MQSISEQSTMLMMSILNVWIEERCGGIFMINCHTNRVSMDVRDRYLLDANALIQNIISLVNTGDAVVIQALQDEITYQWDEFLDNHNFVVEGDQVPVVIVEDEEEQNPVAEDSDSDGEEEEDPMCMVCNINRSQCRLYNGDDWENSVYFCVPCRQEDSDDFKKLLSSIEDV